MGPQPRRRRLYAVSYLLMAAAGVAAVLWPPVSVSSATRGLNALLVVWAAFLIVGGGCSAIGALTDRWLGEYVGLPLLGAVFGIYGASALALARGAGWTTLGGGLAFLAVAGFFHARWAEVGRVRREALAQAESHSDRRKG